jgi:glycine/D-amino acid oxidase-like deaminating enzyme/nitrite reductase/ring-hydroxylating ferredoxin subunit
MASPSLPADAPRWATAPLWSHGRHRPAVGAAAALPPRRWDAIVVGAGLTGLLTATMLRRAGLDPLVLERHDIGGVTTVGSTGKLTALQGARSSTITKLRDADAARTYATAAQHGVRGLRELIAETGIDCALTVAHDVTFAATPDGLERCRTELEAARAAGLPVRWDDAIDLPTATLGGVVLDDQAYLDPGLLAAGLAAQLPGDRVLEGCPVVDVDEHDDHVVVEVEGGLQLEAEHVVIATLGPVHDPSLVTTRVKATRSYVVAAPHPSAPTGMYISLDESTRSIRPAQVAGQPGVVVAGEGHGIGEDGGRSPEERWAALERYCVEELGSEPVTHRWHAHDLVPSDGVPFIGRVSAKADRRWMAGGFQKWGISTAYVAADLLTAQIQGEARPWSELFDPTRLADSLTKELVKDAARSVRHLVGDRVSDIVHGDDRPRCTHLGCVLDFDESERTWDCPCHGSRFDEAGQVIAGPAVTPIEIAGAADRE